MHCARTPPSAEAAASVLSGGETHQSVAGVGASFPIASEDMRQPQPVRAGAVLSLGRFSTTSDSQALPTKSEADQGLRQPPKAPRPVLRRSPKRFSAAASPRPIQTGPDRDSYRRCGSDRLAINYDRLIFTVG